MKEKRTTRRIDLFSILAIGSILLMLLFEGFFVFELYESDAFANVLVRAEPTELVSPSPVESAPEAPQPVPEEEPAPVDPVKTNPTEPVKTNPVG